jgi:hypothetical protein
MSNPSNKTVLQAFRPNTSDESDPFFQQSLAAAKNDPELARWLAVEQNFDQLVRSKLAEIQPADARLRFASLRPQSSQRHRLPIILAAAAVLVFGFFFAYQGLVPAKSKLDLFETQMMAMLGNRPAPKLDLQTDSLAQVDQYLTAHGAPQNKALPARLETMPTAGCRAFTWNGASVSLTCFQLHDGQLLHLLVMDKSKVGSMEWPQGWQTRDGWNLMFQERNGLLILWATQAPADMLKTLIEA